VCSPCPARPVHSVIHNSVPVNCGQVPGQWRQTAGARRRARLSGGGCDSPLPPSRAAWPILRAGPCRRHVGGAVPALLTRAERLRLVKVSPSSWLAQMARRGGPIFMMLDVPFVGGAPGQPCCGFCSTWPALQRVDTRTRRHAGGRPPQGQYPAAGCLPRFWSRAAGGRQSAKAAAARLCARRRPPSYQAICCCMRDVVTRVLCWHCGSIGAKLFGCVGAMGTCPHPAHGFAGMSARKRVDMPTC
jgi:hypothetical protein